MVDEGRRRLSEIGRRSNEVLVLAAGVGVLTGIVVGGFEKSTGEGLLALALRQPLWFQAVCPALGLLVGTLLLRRARLSPSTSDEYIRGFHRPDGIGALRHVPIRLLASLATLGGGSPLGYEGPALYAGAGVGVAVSRPAARFLRSDPKVLLVAGAAAGVAAIFKAPVTGLIFALEVPYQDDVARRMLLPASIASAASYVTFAALVGTAPILPIAGQPPFDFADLGGAALVGLSCGLLARVFVAIIGAAKQIAGSRPLWLRLTGGGSLLAATVLAAEVLESGELALGPGYDVLDWALDPSHSLWAIAAIGTVRVVGTGAAIGAGGAGRLFIPLVIQGALVGRVIGGLLRIESVTLLPVVGMAAFLGAGYRVPLAAVVFVAEFTGRPGFVIPGLVAAVVAQLAMGRRSVSAYQAAGRTGHLEARLRLPLSEVLETGAPTASPDATVQHVFWEYLVRGQQRTVVVADGEMFIGVVNAGAFDAIPADAWSTTLVRELPLEPGPTMTPTDTIEAVLYELEHGDVDRVPVCAEGILLGVVTAAHLLALSELLDES